MKHLQQILCIALFTWVIPQSGLAATLVAGYDFVGGSTNDQVGSFDLTTTTSGTGGVTFGTDGSYSFVSFDNTDGVNMANLGITADIVSNHPSAISFWLRSTSLFDSERPFNNDNGVNIEFDSTNRLRTRDGGGSNAFLPNNSYDLNAWNLVTYYIDANQPSGTLTLFLNSDFATTPADIPDYGGGVQGFNFGGLTGSNEFAADIGGVRVYSDIVDAAAAQTLHNSLLADGGPVAIPEPSSFALLGLGLGSLLLYRRRRQ